MTITIVRDEYLEAQVHMCIRNIQLRRHKVKVVPLEWYSEQVTKEDIPDFVEEYGYFESDIAGLGGTAQYVFNDIYWVEIEGQVLIPSNKPSMVNSAQLTLYQIVTSEENILRETEVAAIRQLLVIYHDKQATKTIRERLKLHDDATEWRRNYRDSSLVTFKHMKLYEQKEHKNDTLELN